jgi:hypothetical protein
MDDHKPFPWGELKARKERKHLFCWKVTDAGRAALKDGSR